MSSLSSILQAPQEFFNGSWETTKELVSDLKEDIFENAPYLAAYLKDKAISTLSSAKESFQNTKTRTKVAATVALVYSIYSCYDETTLLSRAYQSIDKLISIPHDIKDLKSHIKKLNTTTTQERYAHFGAYCLIVGMLLQK
ncbi:MAG: hypothetical protein S4CHLAM7_11610 [Chlamydiae bacterium]|nr:hypothetical protein [Chlamydiota bacterium]